MNPLQEDFNGDKKAWELVANNTSNMLKLLSEVNEMLTGDLIEMSSAVDKVVNAQHYRGDHTGETEQNN